MSEKNKGFWRDVAALALGVIIGSWTWRVVALCFHHGNWFGFVGGLIGLFAVALILFLEADK